MLQMQQRLIFYFFGILLLFIACTKSEEKHLASISLDGSTGWLVPTENIVFKEDAHDQIQSIDKPIFYLFEEAQLDPNEKVFILQAKNHITIYPLEILWHHEIVNDKYQDNFVSITYCPLTGSGIAWDRMINGNLTTFGVSGHLYNHNLIPYDRDTKSYWSQMGLQSIYGSLSGNKLETKHLLYTSVAVAKESFPNASVLHDTSGHVCDSICQVTSTKSGNERISTYLPEDEYFGVIFRQYVLLIAEGIFNDTISIYRTNFKSYKLLIIGSNTNHFITAFLLPASQSSKKFSPVQESLPIIMKDDLNNYYNLMGSIVEGPDTGKRLDSPPSFWAKAFAWELFYPDFEVFED